MEKKHKDVVGEVSQRIPKVKPFLCHICNKSYTTESALQIHAVKHRSAGDSESSRPASEVESPPNLAGLGFGCQHCPETFISTEGLVEHMKVAHVHHSPFTIHPLPFGPAPPPGAHWFERVPDPLTNIHFQSPPSFIKKNTTPK